MSNGADPGHQRQDQERLLASVKKAIRELAPRQQQVVLLHYYQGLPADEIARRTGLSTRTVYNSLHTAFRNSLCRLFSQEIIIFYLYLYVNFTE